MTLDDGIARGPARARRPRGYLTNPALAPRVPELLGQPRRRRRDVGLMDRWTQIAGAVARALAHEHSSWATT